jgi:Rieske Fe-S protein
MNKDDKSFIECIWYIFYTIATVAAGYNLWKASKKVTESEDIKMLKTEIKIKDAYIQELEKKISQYQKILKNDSHIKRKLE